LPSPALTLFSIAIVSFDDATDTESPLTPLIASSSAAVGVPAGRSMTIEPWTDADAGVPHGRTVAPMLKVIAGTAKAITSGLHTPNVHTFATPGSRGTAGMVRGQADVPPTPESASVHLQPRAVERSGFMIVQMGPDEVEADSASTTPGVMTSRRSMCRRGIIYPGSLVPAVAGGPGFASSGDTKKHTFGKER
jgi:hypothetical protein